MVETLAGQLKPYIGDVLLNGTPIEHAQTEVTLVQSNDLHLPLLNVFETLKVKLFFKNDIFLVVERLLFARGLGSSLKH